MHTPEVADEDQEKVPKDCVISTRALSEHSFLFQPAQQTVCWGQGCCYTALCLDCCFAFVVFSHCNYLNCFCFVLLCFLNIVSYQEDLYGWIESLKAWKGKKNNTLKSAFCLHVVVFVLYFYIMNVGNSS